MVEVYPVWGRGLFFFGYGCLLFGITVYCVWVARQPQLGLMVGVYLIWVGVYIGVYTDEGRCRIGVCPVEGRVLVGVYSVWGRVYLSGVGVYLLWGRGLSLSE